MYIFPALILFLILSFVAACDGDWSGLAMIGQAILLIVVFLFVCYIAVHPILLLIIGIIGVIVFLTCCSK